MKVPREMADLYETFREQGGKQEGFLRCQTPASTVKLKVEGCRVKNGGCWIESEE
jgi:hypothetical protein